MVINTLTMLTIAHANRGRPTPKDDERFQNRLVRDLNIRILNKCWQELSTEFESAQIPNFTMISFIETKIHGSTSCSTYSSSQFDIVYISISKFNTLNKALIQYCSHFNINIATFVAFQIAVYAYVVQRAFTYTSPSSPS